MSHSSKDPRHSIKRIGVISDTHGLVREAALAALRESELIVHAGDIGSPAVLHALEQIARTHAVRGNNDRAEWAASVPARVEVALGAHRLYVLHDISELDFDPAAAGYAAVISGHSHKPRIEWRDGVLYLNPGSAGPRRFRLPISVARLRVSKRGIEPELVELPATG